ncbi:hypothetical protein OEZ85_011062 [Tetradesmus obliquus]|uniref:Protein kinase domain-containing protein n=1 Tax=Tetradesmus obliquus TaxID=3088 RepID=A0ABY8TRG4_TETOB|nr:hypothetical protein OEZ85_011062 [Tetradesmus obliquus]
MRREGRTTAANNCIRNTFSLELILHDAADVASHPVVHGVVAAVARAMQQHPRLRLYLCFATLLQQGPCPKAAACLRGGVWSRPPEWKYTEFDDAIVLGSSAGLPGDEAAIARALHLLQQEQGAISDKLQATIMRGLLHALNECHEKCIVHGDVKPANIMFTSPLCTDVQLIDFGSSCCLDRASASARCHFGTPAYAAPEILRNRTCTSMSDAWSAGVLLHQMLTQAKVPAAELCLIGSKALSSSPHSKAAADLVQCLLKVDPADRLHPYEALGHPYFKRQH